MVPLLKGVLFMMKIWKILLIIVAILVVCLIGFVATMMYLNKSTTGDDGVAAGYAEKISFSGQLEQRYSKPGPYQVVESTQDGGGDPTKEYHIYRPQSADSAGKTFPLVLMANGTKTPSSAYAPILEHLASWGFVVVGNEDPNSGSGASTSAMLDAILQMNGTERSPLRNIVNTNKIGVSGHSQGGAGAINAATNYPNSGQYAALYTASAIENGNAKRLGCSYDTSSLKAQYFMMAGTEASDSFAISPLKDLTQNFEAPNAGKPGVMARRKGADHKDVLEFGDPYMTAWFLWTLSDDKEAEKVFAGPDAELAHNSDWKDVQTRNMPN